MKTNLFLLLIFFTQSLSAQTFTEVVSSLFDSVEHSSDPFSNMFGDEDVLITGENNLEEPISKQYNVNNKWYIEIGGGITTFGPSNKMSQLMIDYGFNDDSYGFFSGDVIKHPHYYEVGLTYQVAIHRDLNQKSQIGIQFSQANFSEVSGYSDRVWYLSVTFSNMSFIPLYSYELNNSISLKAGPVLQINKGNRSSSTHTNTEKYTKLSPGILGGLSLKVWDGRVSYGEIIAQYQYGLPCRMGPFTASRINESPVVIPESKLGFGHLSINFVLGFHGNL